jgi:predicted flap endonuclease-1-like 5' DNA nuclease
VVLRTVSLWQRQGRALVQLLLTHTDEPFTDADLTRLGGLGAKIAGHLEEEAAALS